MKLLRAIALALLVCLPTWAQVAAPLPITHYQFSDANGNPLAGGFVYTCVAGSSCPGTPQTSYSNATGSANTNPIVLDAGGFADIWGGTLPYKLVVQDLNGVQQWVADNVPTALVVAPPPTSASSITFVASGASASTITVATALNMLPSVTYYGAAGTCAVDDTAAFNRTISATAGKAFFVPDGCYKISTPLAPPISTSVGTSMMCASQQTVIKYYGSGEALNLVGGGNANSGLTVANCTFDGTNAAASTVGVHEYAFSAGKMDNVQIRNFPGDGVFNQGGIGIVWLNPSITNNGGKGMHNVGVVAGGTSYAANANKVYGGTIGYNGGWGVYEDAALIPTTGPNQNNIYDGVVFEQNGTSGVPSGNVYFQGCDSCVLEKSYLEYFTSGVPWNVVIGGTASDGIGNVASTPHNIIVANNILFSKGTPSVKVVNAQGWSVTYNTDEGLPSYFFDIGTGIQRLGHALYNVALAAVSGFWTGTDSGDLDADFGVINGHGVTASSFGQGFNNLTGLSQDLTIRTRQGGTNTLNFLKAGGGTNGWLTDAGVLDLQAFITNGPLTFNVPGAHILTQSLNTDLQFVVTFGTSVTSASYTFATPYTNAPHCYATPLSGLGSGSTANTFYVSTTTTAATVNTVLAATGISFAGFCIGAPN